jgi:hypothetical protein
MEEGKEAFGDNGRTSPTRGAQSSGKDMQISPKNGSKGEDANKI